MRINTIKSIILFTIFLSSAEFADSQTFIGLQHSNLGGIHQSSLNPANIANSRHRIYVNGITGGFSFNNDYLKLNFPFPFINLITGNVPAQYQNGTGGLNFQDDWLKENVNNKPKNMNLTLQTRVPGFMISLPKGFALGFQYKNTFSIQVNDVAEPLARLARYGIDSSRGSVSYSGPNQFQVGQTFGDNSFTVNVNAFGEVAVTLAKTIVSDNNFVLKAGVTPKLLLGYASGYIKNRGMLIKAAGTDTIVFGETDVEYGYTDPGKLEDLQSINVNVLNSKLQGSGFGFDIGAAFEYNPSGTKKVTNGKNNYLFRGGVSLMDGGHITYNKNLRNTRITNTGGDKMLIITPEFADAWAGEDGQERGIKFTDSVMRTIFQVDTGRTSFQSKMPATLNIQFDYNLLKMFYVGANFSQDLRGKKAIGMRKPSYFMLIPRMETKFFELALPLGMMNDYRNPRLGIYLRIGPAFIGSDNLIGQLRGKEVYGLDLYFGLSMGINKKKDNSDDKTETSPAS